MTVFLKVKKTDKAFLIEKLKLGLDEVKTQYEIFRLKNRDISMVLFNSGKLVLQGKDENVMYYSKLLKSSGFVEQKKIEFVKQEGIYIGSDESLKGDTFGGIVVVGVRANNIQRENLKMLGVMDSKKIKDKDIGAYSDEIRKMVKVSVQNLPPNKYNAYKFGLTKLMNKLHKEVYADLKQSSVKSKWVVDKYPGCNVGDIAVIKAESKYVEVAAASIIARDFALQQLAKLSAKLGIKVPKGSSHVQSALEYLKKSKRDPKQYVKMNWSNVQEVFG
tara:strand:+ start:104 stop:928 length:825 start_codon:yes stop_codon:yes gene_type:complete